jgi:hypothetical protein
MLTGKPHREQSRKKSVSERESVGPEMAMLPQPKGKFILSARILNIIPQIRTATLGRASGCARYITGSLRKVKNQNKRLNNRKGTFGDGLVQQKTSRMREFRILPKKAKQIEKHKTFSSISPSIIVIQ